MRINVTRRLTLALMTLAMFVFVVGAAVAGPVKAKAHHHNSGHSLIGDRLKTNGTHQLHKNGKHTVSAEVRNGKITAFHAKHDTKGEVAIKKYKTNKKMAMLDGEPGSLPAQTDLGTTYIAYAYLDDDGNEEYYWFPYEEIQDGDTGAITYVPLS